MIKKEVIITGDFTIGYPKNGVRNLPLRREDAVTLLELLKGVEQTNEIKWLVIQVDEFIERGWA